MVWVCKAGVAAKESTGRHFMMCLMYLSGRLTVDSRRTESRDARRQGLYRISPSITVLKSAP
jgi:hypothetical protein